MLSIPTVRNDSISGVLFAMVTGGNHKYWYISKEKIESLSTGELVSTYGIKSTLTAVLTFLKYEQFYSGYGHAFLYHHLFDPLLLNEIGNITFRGWCLIEVVMYDPDGNCPCLYYNGITGEIIENVGIDFDPEEDDPTWIHNYDLQENNWTITPNDGSLIHGINADGYTVYHFWSWCPDENDQDPWEHNWVNNTDDSDAGSTDSTPPPNWDYNGPSWEENERECMFIFNHPHATALINQLEEQLLTEVCTDAAVFAVENAINDLIIDLCNEYYANQEDDSGEFPEFPTSPLYNINETLEQITTTVEDHPYYQLGMGICLVCESVPQPQQCYNEAENCHAEGYEECILDIIFRERFGKEPDEDRVINLADTFRDCFGNPDEDGNYIDCNNAGNATFEFTLYSDQPVENSREPFLVSPFGVDVGHTFISLHTNIGGNDKTVTYGFYPIERPDLDNQVVPMMIQDDGEEDYSVSVTMQLDCDEFNQVISHSISATSNLYDLQNYNCTDYGIEIANCVGLGVAETTSPWIVNNTNYGNSRNPGDLGEDIKNLSTGTIDQNGGKGPITNCE